MFYYCLTDFGIKAGKQDHIRGEFLFTDENYLLNTKVSLRIMFKWNWYTDIVNVYMLTMHMDIK